MTKGKGVTKEVLEEWIEQTNQWRLPKGFEDFKAPQLYGDDKDNCRVLFKVFCAINGKLNETPKRSKR